MKKLVILIGLVICVSCTASPEASSTMSNKEETQSVQKSHAGTTTTIHALSQTRINTQTNEPINTLNPTEQYENTKAERFYFYFLDKCKGYTRIENISPELNWSLCATTNSLILRSYEDQEWEISLLDIYRKNIDEQKVAPVFWTNDDKYVYIEYYFRDKPLQHGTTIALWRVDLVNGKFKEVLLSSAMDNNTEYYAYTISISPNGSRLAYSTTGKDVSLNIIDLLTDERSYFNMGRGYAYDSLFWSPDESKLAFAMAKETSYPETYTNDIYLVEYPDKVMRLINSKSMDEFIVQYYIEFITNDIVIVTDGNNRYEYEIATGNFSIMPKN